MLISRIKSLEGSHVLRTENIFSNIVVIGPCVVSLTMTESIHSSPKRGMQPD